MDKIRALKLHRGNYDAFLALSPAAVSDAVWWLEHVASSFKPVTQMQIDFDFFTDASMTGWGAFLPHRDKRDRGLWSDADKLEHINVLELKAVFARAYCCVLSSQGYIICMLTT